MNNRLEPTSPEVDAIRTIFEVHVTEDPDLKLPRNLQDFRDPQNPLRYVNQPAWLSSMWYGFLLSRRTTWVYRHPDFEGDYVHASQFLDQGIRVNERSAKCEADSVRVSALELLDVLNDMAMPAERLALTERCEAVLNPIQKRDLKAKKK